MMEVEIVSETLGFYPQLTRLVAREDFIEHSYYLQFMVAYTCTTTEFMYTCHFMHLTTYHIHIVKTLSAAPCSFSTDNVYIDATSRLYRSTVSLKRNLNDVMHVPEGRRSPLLMKPLCDCAAAV
jgi:hypothetical protein